MDTFNMDTSISLLQDKLSVFDIPEEIVTELWNTNFLDLELSLPPDHQVYQPDSWQEFISFCISCREDTVGVWNILMRAGVRHDTITAAVFLSVSANGSTNLNLSACLGYVCILSVEGANIYKLFHPAVFHKCVQLLSSSVRQVCKRSNVQVMTQEEDLDMDIELAEENYEGSIEGPGILHSILVEIKVLLTNFRFQLHPDSLFHLISSLFSVITRYPLDDESCIVNRLAWLCVEEVHKPLHGNEKDILTEIIKHLFPLLTFKGVDSKNSSTISKPQQKLCVQALSYINYILDTGLMDREAKITFIVLPRHICLKCPVHTQYKTRGAKVIKELVSYFQGEDFSAFFCWFSSLTHSKRHEHRNVSVSVALEFISTTDIDCEVCIDTISANTTKLYTFLLDWIVRICSDSVSPVRTNALNAIYELSTNSNLPHVQDAIKSLITASGDSTSHLLDLLSNRLLDQKAGVRKSALSALEGVLRLLSSDAIIEWMRPIRKRAFDVSLSVRKQAIISLRELLLSFPNYPPVQDIFLSGLLPLVLDPEASVQERCVEVLMEEIFSQLRPYKTDETELLHSWSLLSHICGEHYSDYHLYFTIFLQRLNKAKKLTAQLISKLITYTTSPNHLDAWRLLALLSEQTESINVDTVYNAWRKAIDTPDRCHHQIFSMIKILSNLHSKLTDFQADKLQMWMSGELEKSTMSPDNIKIYVNALILLCHSKNPANRRPGWFSMWTADMIRNCSVFVKEWLHRAKDISPENLTSEDKFVTSLSLLGELITVSPDEIDPDIPPLIQWALIQKPSLNPDTSLRSIRPDLSPRVRAFICIMFGKLCLVKQDLAYDSPDLLAEELFTSNSVPLKSNIIIILCDMCVRYPNLIENYLSHISPCLKDGSYVVRRQTLTLLTKLIQEDYIKLKGTLIYHLLAVINDTEDELRDLVHYCLKHVLLKKYPRALYHHFIESIFYFQHNSNHPSCNQFTQTDTEIERFCLPGVSNTRKRFNIYNYMLEQLSDEQRFNLSGRIVQEILGSTVDKVLKLNIANSLLITDALSILCSDEIKLSYVKTHSPDNLEDDEREAMEDAVNLQSNMIKTLVKKDVIENIIPTIISMKRLLQKERSPIISNLMGYLHRLKDDYKDKFTEVLSADKQLAEEIEFDIKRYEEDQKQVRRSISMRASLSAAEVVLAHTNLSPVVLLSPHSVSVTKTLRDAKIRSRVENTPAVLQLNRLTNIQSENRRKVASPLSITHNYPVVAIGEGSPELNKTSQRRKKPVKTNRPRARVPKEKKVSFLTPPSLEQDVLMNNTFGSPPLRLNTSLSTSLSARSMSLLTRANVISFSPTDECSGITPPPWNLRLRQGPK
ncbi:hypothetical protein LOD99_7740 [Oopsacas minuta]|uniref:Condensin complex subunit 1 C-terminal domain-containing protein n=1 Tax=Oopsacas minuta TaxID=111878 RepID=A0AAV7JQ57_9METZ|nr:hypothetical protein LOD99_7740 [Oopsacas minuta]